ncbi:hypothetical protein BDN70DRAFT_799946 [Pholiota conissans]|uniref:Uncharacterized protein n=1 Tax=Pholiota conissans TaxID=109636 RepID=A0A9P5ZCE6_9AGAR|nr:hypothetical protein BDN70DRAFT_799946 [Pholiota conissans]
MDNAWCPVCDKQIEPKRTTLFIPRAVPQPPPPPPPSSPRKKGAPRKAGLVNGTGRLQPNGTIKPPPAPAAAPAMRKRIIIDQGPTPLYCSDECKLADLARTRRGAPLDPHAEESVASPKKVFSTGASDSDASSADGSPKRAMTSMDRFNAYYGFPEFPEPLVLDDDEPPVDIQPTQYSGGIMMAGRLITSLCPPPAKPHTGRYRPVQEPRKPTPGWNDGSNMWRSAVYSFTAPSDSPFQPDAISKAYGSVVASPHRARKMTRASSSLSAAEPVPAHRASSASEAMLSSFSENFTRRSESRASLYVGGGSATSPVPSSAASTHSLPLPSPKQRSLVPSGAEGKLLVPDVKMKVRSGSSASLSSHWSGPATSSSRRSASVRSPLSMTSDSDEDTERCSSNLSSRKKTTAPENTRSWSYENVKTYDIMPMKPKLVKKKEKRIVDGEEVEVEIEVEEYPERKRLFLFPPSQRISVP